ncbi:hypothetical protein F2X42_001774 [Escherichia coli]|nr:hypothetical protein [Escherichia coli]
MKKNTRFAFNAYLQQLARLNGVAVEELSSKFTVEPSVQQTLEDQIQQSAAFLTLINVTPVTEQSGQLLGLGVGSTIAGTTDTTAKEREPVDPTLMVDVEYKCEQTNFDTVLTYAKLDLWAKFQDFQVRIRDAIVKRQALDRIMIGFNGVKRAKTSNRSENPLLQDVNKGWLQKIREDAPDHVMGSSTTGGETTPRAVKVGKGGEYANLDAVVMDAVNPALREKLFTFEVDILRNDVCDISLNLQLTERVLVSTDGSVSSVEAIAEPDEPEEMWTVKRG